MSHIKSCKRSISWEEDKNLGANYAKNKLILDANQGFGRNSRAVQLKSKEEREAVGEETFSDDDGGRLIYMTSGTCYVHPRD